MKNVFILLTFLLTIQPSLFIYGQEQWKQVLPSKVSGLSKNWIVRGINFQTFCFDADSIIGFAMVNYRRVSDGANAHELTEPKIMSTRDSGQHWMVMPTEFDTVLCTGAVRLDSLHYFWGGVYTHYYYSNDGSRTWKMLSPAAMPASSLVNFSSATCPLVGVTSYNYYFDTFVTLDGGQSFIQIHKHDTIQHTSIDYQYFYNAWSIDSNSFLVQRRWPYNNNWGVTNYLTTDRGKTWNHIGFTIDGFISDSSHNDYFTSVFFITSKLGIAAGFRKNSDTDTTVPGSNVLYRTTDGGNSWNTIALFEYDYEHLQLILRNMSADGNLVASFGRGQVVISRDSGRTWEWLVKKMPIVKSQSQDSSWVLAAGMQINNLSSGIFCAGSFQSEPVILTLSPEMADNVENDRSGRNSITGSPIEIRKVYPNPSSTLVSLTIDKATNIDRATTVLRVYDMLGTCVLTLAPDQIRYSPSDLGNDWYDAVMDFSSLQSGMYFLEMSAPWYSGMISFLHVKP